MQDGWYCRATTTLSQEEAAEQNVEVDDDEESTVDDDSREVRHAKNFSEAQANNPENADPKSQYRYLKRKLKFLVYENEFLQEVLRSNQRRLLKVSRDRTFLLDRLLQYEKPDDSSESDLTESSDEEVVEAKKKKTEANTSLAANNSAGNTPTAPTRGRKRKAPQNNGECNQEQIPARPLEKPTESMNATLQRSEQFIDQQLVMRLAGTQPANQMPEVVLDREGREHLLDGNVHVAAEECVKMEYTAT